jgi:methylenetetrahydrofolate reductase (NADPH)
MTGLPQMRSPPPGGASAAAVHAALLRGASLEVSARDKDGPKALAAILPGGTRIHVTHLPNGDWREIVATARGLAAEGLVPVPHIAARSLRDAPALAAYLAGLNGEAGVADVLLVAGDPATPRGPFPDSLSVLRTGLLQKNGIASVTFAGHPEGHPHASDAVMLEALRKKVEAAEEAGLSCSVITQLCFEARPILDWLRRVRRAGIAAPVSVGLAAPTNPAMLMKFALRCGVGPSIRALTSQAARIGALLRDAGPDRIVADLSGEMAQAGAGEFGAVRGLHLFVFGSSAKAAHWLLAQRPDGAADRP